MTEKNIFYRNSFLRITKTYWISILLCTIILTLCFISSSDLPKVGVQNFDKFVHFLMFGGLSGAVFFDNTNYLRKQISFRRIFWGSFVFPTALGGIIEIMQADFTLTRSGDWLDFLFDIIGTSCGLLICVILNKYVLKPKR